MNPTIIFQEFSETPNDVTALREFVRSLAPEVEIVSGNERVLVYCKNTEAREIMFALLNHQSEHGVDLEYNLNQLAVHFDDVMMNSFYTHQRMNIITGYLVQESLYNIDTQEQVDALIKVTNEITAQAAMNATFKMRQILSILVTRMEHAGISVLEEVNKATKETVH